MRATIFTLSTLCYLAVEPQKNNCAAPTPLPLLDSQKYRSSVGPSRNNRAEPGGQGSSDDHIML